MGGSIRTKLVYQWGVPDYIAVRDYVAVLEIGRATSCISMLGHAVFSIPSRIVVQCAFMSRSLAALCQYFSAKSNRLFADTLYMLVQCWHHFVTRQRLRLQE